MQKKIYLPVLNRFFFLHNFKIINKKTLQISIFKKAQINTDAILKLALPKIIFVLTSYVTKL